MKWLLPVLTALLLPWSAFAQSEIDVTPLYDDIELPELVHPAKQKAEIAEQGVLVRALDKVSGELVDFDLLPDQTKQLGRIRVTLTECRYPAQNPNGDAFAYLTIRDNISDVPVFSGWMIASSPALNGLDHARYDVWPIRCKIAAGD